MFWLITGRNIETPTRFCDKGGSPQNGLSWPHWVRRCLALRRSQLYNWASTHLKIRLASRKCNTICYPMRFRKNVSEEWLTEKTRTPRLFCVKRGWMQNGWSCHFRANHNSERYLSSISLDIKLPRFEEKQALFLRVWVRTANMHSQKRCCLLRNARQLFILSGNRKLSLWSMIG